MACAYQPGFYWFVDTADQLWLTHLYRIQPTGDAYHVAVLHGDHYLITTEGQHLGLELDYFADDSPLHPLTKEQFECIKCLRGPTYD